MRKLLLVAALVLPACGSDGGNPPTPVTQPPAPPVTQPPPPAPPPVANVTGSWDSAARRWHYRLQHSNSSNTVTGQLLGYANVYYPNPNHSDLAIRGTVTSAGAISFGCRSDGVFFEGRIESASRMTGTSYDCVNGCRSYGDVLTKTAN